MKLYVAWGSRELDQKVQYLHAADDADSLNRISQSVSQATEFWRSWAFSMGGEIISLNGHSGMAKVPADRLDELPTIRTKFGGRIGVTVSVGVGTKPSEATKAYQVAEMEGGKIKLYTPEVDQILESKQEKPQEAADILAEEYLKAEPPMHRDLEAIALLSKTGDLRLDPEMAYEEYAHNPGLQRVYPKLNQRTFASTLRKNITLRNSVAIATWERIKGNTKDLSKTAFVWRWGRHALAEATEELVKTDTFVLQFLGSREELRKSRAEAAAYLPLRKGSFSPGGPETLTAPSGNSPALNQGGGRPGMSGAKKPAPATKPKREGSEHSDGEKMRSMMENSNPGVETTHAAKDFQDQLQEASETSEDEDGAQAQQVENTESADQIRQQVIQVLSQFKSQYQYMEQIKQENPELYEAFMQVVGTMVNMARELIAQQDEVAEGITTPANDSDERNPETNSESASPSEKSDSETNSETKKDELAATKAELPMPHAAAHHNLNLPTGSYKEGVGKIKVQHGDGKTGWVQARAGQIMSQDGHPISALNPGGR